MHKWHWKTILFLRLMSLLRRLLVEDATQVVTCVAPCPPSHLEQETTSSLAALSCCEGREKRDSPADPCEALVALPVVDTQALVGRW
jgi:hypothetical protein